MRRIDFFKTTTGVSPVEEFLDTLSDAQVKKILWVMKLVRDLGFQKKTQKTPRREIELAETRKREHQGREVINNG